MIEGALQLARSGWPVFPCSPADKAPLVPRESNPGAKDGGLYLASTEEAQIRAWWDRWPKAMIGVPTGQRIGAFVVDLDPKSHTADAMLKALQDWLQLPSLPPCPVSRTRSGGLHLFFRMPSEKLGNRASLFRKIAGAPETIREHVDIRGDGGYVIVPPSRMSDGAAYSWEQEPDEEFPEAPQLLLDAIAKRLNGAAAGSPQDPPPAAARQRPPAHEAQAKAQRRYAMAALDREIGELRNVPEGSRGFECNKVAYSLGGLVGAGLVSETLIRAEIFGACELNGLVAKDGVEKVRQNIARAVSAGAAKPIDISQIGARAGTSQRNPSRAARARPPDDPQSAASSPAPSDDDQENPSSQRGSGPSRSPDEGSGDELNLRCALLPMTDLGNAQRFILRSGRDFLHVEEWGWQAWDSKRWNGHDAEAMVQRAVHATVKAIADEAHMLRLYSLAFDDDEHMLRRKKAFVDGESQAGCINPIVDIKAGKIITQADRLQGWCLASQSNAHVTCMSKLAQHYLSASPDSFNADPMSFNVENGTLRFKKVEDEDYVTFHPHHRADRITKVAPVTYDPAAECELYDRFLLRTHPDADDAGNELGGAAMRRHLHAWGGVSLTALQIPKLSFWYGTGRNGKSVLADTWAHILGDYVQSIPIESFLDSGRARRGGEASPDIASLPGVRMLRTSEPEKRSKLAESMIKLVTGGEPLRARHLNRDFFEFKPVFKLIMQGNYKPSIEGTDEGIWARMMVVPWLVMIPEAERDPLLTEKLKAEASGILNRLLDGLRDYLDNGLSPPDAVKVATQEYREDSDPIGRFLRDCTRPELKARTAGGDLYKLYEAWAKANGDPKWSPKAFKRGLADHGIRAMKSSSMFYLDIVATKTVDDFAGQGWGDDDKGNER
jgi:putative DNA primase/helicase